MLFRSFFFFKQKTAYEIMSGDWSSDVCSSDLTLDKDIVSGARRIAGTMAFTKILDRKSVV